MSGARIRGRARATSVFVAAGMVVVLTTLGIKSVGADTWVCPLALPGTIRGPDACASEGGSFAARRGARGIHSALDINSEIGIPVLAIRQGLVVVADANWGAMGGTVLLDHGDGWYSVYGHLGAVEAQAGRAVAAGDRLGSVGYTGNASCLRDRRLPPHLHISMHRLDRPGLGSGALPLRQLREHGYFLDAMTSQSGAFGAQDPARELGGLGCWN